MNTKTKSPAVTFYDGCLADRDVILLCGKLDFLEVDDYSHSRNYSFKNNKWGGADLPFMTSSICTYRPANSVPSSFAMCTLAQMAGCVDFYWSGGVRKEVEALPGASDHGGLLNLQQIRQIGDDLFVVGSASQVFRRHDGTWTNFNQGLESTPVEFFRKQGKNLGEAVALSQKTSAVLNSIDGSSAEDLYAAGYFGAIYHRHAEGWRRMEPATNVTLHRVKLIDAQTIYAVGDKGILLQGNSSGFHAVYTGINDDLWGLEWFRGKLYIGTKQSGLYVYDGKSVNRVMTTPKRDFDCPTLHACNGQLLVLGSKDIFLTDDCLTWRVIDHPDNQ